MTTSELTKIERKIFVRGSRRDVWRALTSTEGFSKWFSVEMESPFAEGKRVDMISREQSCNGMPFYVIVERMEPEHTFTWRWHPGSASTSEDGTTLVEFHVAEADGGTVVTVTETGFDAISLERRAKAFAENEHGWDTQLDSLRRYADELYAEQQAT